MKKFLKSVKKWLFLIIAPIPLAAIVLILDLVNGGTMFWLQGIAVLGIAWIPSFFVFFIMTIVKKKHKTLHPVPETVEVQKLEESK